MATLLAHVRIKPGAEARFEQIAADMYRHTHGDEADVRRYEYWRGAEAGTYYCLESFPDLDGFLTHQTTAHHSSYGPALREVIAEMHLEWVDPLAHASPLAPTNTVALRPDATETYRLAHERFSSVVAGWWLDLRHLTDPSQEAH